MYLSLWISSKVVTWFTIQKIRRRTAKIYFSATHHIFLRFKINFLSLCLFWWQFFVCKDIFDFETQFIKWRNVGRIFSATIGSLTHSSAFWRDTSASRMSADVSNFFCFLFFIVERKILRDLCCSTRKFYVISILLRKWLILYLITSSGWSLSETVQWGKVLCWNTLQTENSQRWVY